MTHNRASTADATTQGEMLELIADVADEAVSRMLNAIDGELAERVPGWTEGALSSGPTADALINLLHEHYLGATASDDLTPDELVSAVYGDCLGFGNAAGGED